MTTEIVRLVLTGVALASYVTEPATVNHWSLAELALCKTISVFNSKSLQVIVVDNVLLFPLFTFLQKKHKINPGN